MPRVRARLLEATCTIWKRGQGVPGRPVGQVAWQRRRLLVPRSHGAARVPRALPTALQAQPCHLVLRSSRPPIERHSRASQSPASSCAGGAERRVRPSLSPGERAVGRASTARARVPAWGATSVRKHKALRGGPPACRPRPHRRATPDLPPQQRRSHRRHRPPGRPRPRPGPPPAHAPCRAPSSGRTDGVTQPTAGSCLWGGSHLSRTARRCRHPTLQLRKLGLRGAHILA